MLLRNVVIVPSYSGWHVKAGYRWGIYPSPQISERSSRDKVSNPLVRFGADTGLDGARRKSGTYISGIVYVNAINLEMLSLPNDGVVILR
jgi:hypothetical protein